MCVHAKSLQLCLTLCDPMDYIAHQAPMSMRFSGEDAAVSCRTLLWGILPIHGSNSHLLCLLH